jgi:hypothetical protein
VAVSVHSPAEDDGLWHWGADTRLQEVEGRRRLASEGVGLCEKRWEAMGMPVVCFGPSRERTREGGPGLVRYVEGKGREVRWCSTRSSGVPDSWQWTGAAPVGASR